MKSLTGKFTSVGGWAPLLALLLGAGLMISACGDEEVPTPTTPAPAPAPTPTPTPTPPPDPEPTGPATPTGLRVTAATSNSITWTWNAVEGVLGYQGQFSTDAVFTDAGNTFLIVAPATSHTIQNLSGNTTGYFRVRSGTGTSLTDLSYSDWTDGTPGTTSAPPAAVALDAPDNLESSDPENDSIVLEWDEVDDAETYEVEQRVAGAGGSWNDAECGDGGDNEVEGTTCVASGLSEGTDYEFRVRGVPADDDDAHTIGAWAEVNGTTEGRTAATTSGGMGDLGVTWESDADSITFSWEPMAGAEYEWKVLDTFNDDADPCEDVAAFDTGMGTEFSEEVRVQNINPGVRGLCVRIKDDDLDDDEKGLSFAWGVVTPAAPMAGTRVDEDGVTESMSWTAINLISDFEWELRLVEDQGRKDGSITDTSSPSDVQKACAAGDHIDDGEADLGLTLSHTVDSGIVHYAGYSLCLQYSNTTGNTDWAVDTDEIYTTPGQPPAPSHQSGRTVTATDNAGVRQTETHTWTVATRDADTPLPREADEYNVKIVTYPEYFLDDTTRTRTDAPSATTDCEAGVQGDQQQWTFAAVTLTPIANNTLGGFEFSSNALDVPANAAENTLVRVCVQATEGSKEDENIDGPWRIGGAVTITKNPAP